MIKVFIIIGTRPEVIKTSILHKLLLADENFESILCSTGQHKELVVQACSSFNTQLDIELDAMAHNASISAQMAYMMQTLQKLIDTHAPDMIIVQGDTLSSYCGALIAFYNKIKLGHIESGLRTFNKWGPFPEEIHRKHIDDISDFHFAPTDLARQNLLNEGHTTSSVYLTGNTGIDALLHIRKALLDRTISASSDIIHLASSPKKKALVTLHRRESQGALMTQIMNEIMVVAEKLNLQIILPLHPNPSLKNISAYSKHPLIKIINPTDYIDMVWLMMHCDVILSDSGGVQEEAPYLEKNVIVLRNETERTEAISNSSNVMYKPNQLLADVTSILNQEMNKFNLPFGDGKASQKILHIIKDNLT